LRADLNLRTEKLGCDLVTKLFFAGLHQGRGGVDEIASAKVYEEVFLLNSERKCWFFKAHSSARDMLVRRIPALEDGQAEDPTMASVLDRQLINAWFAGLKQEDSL
jgi:hypothetical protein